jgi:hypothetical protein
MGAGSMPTRLVPTNPLPLLLVGALLGCTEEVIPVPGIYHPTLVQVSPGEFLGTVPCRPGATGAMQAYVATIFDVGLDTDPTPPFALPSSGPVSCKNPVSFSRVLEPRRYQARVDGYDRADLLPLGSDDPRVTLGVPILVDPITGDRVPPRWTTTCGESKPVTARLANVRTISNCDPLVDSGTPAPTTVEVTIESALGELECGSEPGQIERFEVGLIGGPRRSASCGETLTFGDVPAVGAVPFTLLAYEPGATDARWGSTCEARPAAGITVQATCSPLDDEGALDVAPEDALAALGLDCSALGELRVELLDGGEPVSAPLYVEPSGCGLPVRLTGVTSGPAEARATLVAAGVVLGSARCTGVVVPGNAITSACAAEP